MTTETTITIAERIERLMNHLDIDKAHFAGRAPLDWVGSATAYPERFLSLTLAFPRGFDPQAVGELASRTMVFNGDRGTDAEAIDRIAKGMPGVVVQSFSDYLNEPWSDVIADHADEIGTTLLRFLAEKQADDTKPVASSTAPEGEVAGITYQLHGSGAPLLLLPMGLAPSQWEPLIARLSEHYCTITLAGAELSAVFALEARGRSAEYIGTVRNLVIEGGLQSGESILDVGSGSGVVTRWLAEYTQRESPITGIDINAYLVREATALAHKEGLADTISFQEGNAESLSFPDNSFDFLFSSTALEEGDAERMLSEMVRVTKPGGKVAVAVRAIDFPFVVNLPLRSELKAKVENFPFYGVAERGCADASLYRRFLQAGLTEVKKSPQFQTFDTASPILRSLEETLFLIQLSDEEQAAWRAARQEAGDAYFISSPFHCAVGTKV
jgi:ubiquinone/menaquinone biosynthesis C-methylase UbiE